MRLRIEVTGHGSKQMSLGGSLQLLGQRSCERCPGFVRLLRRKKHYACPECKRKTKHEVVETRPFKIVRAPTLMLTRRDLRGRLGLFVEQAEVRVTGFEARGLIAPQWVE